MKGAGARLGKGTLARMCRCETIDVMGNDADRNQPTDMTHEYYTPSMKVSKETYEQTSPKSERPQPELSLRAKQILADTLAALQAADDYAFWPIEKPGDYCALMDCVIAEAMKRRAAKRDEYFQS